jgi:hypothetical protein
MLTWGSLRNKPLWAIIIIKLSHLLLTVSSAVNILIYSYKVQPPSPHHVLSRQHPHLFVQGTATFSSPCPQASISSFIRTRYSHLLLTVSSMVNILIYSYKVQPPSSQCVLSGQYPHLFVQGTATFTSLRSHRSRSSSVYERYM